MESVGARNRENRLPELANIGLTPQSVNTLAAGVQGRGDRAAEQLIQDAMASKMPGFRIVVEMVPPSWQRGHRCVGIPTIGIGVTRMMAGGLQLLGLNGLFTQVPQAIR